MTNSLLTASGIKKSFGSTQILHRVDLSVAEGEFVAVMGPSGSGKSTMLNAISGLDDVDAGRVWLDGTELTALGPDQLADVRRKEMGFVFQQPTLLRDLGLLDNIVLTSALDSVGTDAERVAKAEALMARAGIAGLGDRIPSQVSGGQLQRAGICRALMRDPKILFGDEPTGALNSRAADDLMDLLVELNREGMAMLVVTHDAGVAARAQRVVFMRDGHIVEEISPDGSHAVEAISHSMRALAI